MNGHEAPLRPLLKRVFGHDAFRPFQEAVCRSVTEGRDALLVMPTGAGKSLCYQLPGMARAGTALVISPLIALMEDQVARLRALGLAAERIHSGIDRLVSRQVCRDYLGGKLDFLFVAPERLSVPGFPEMLAKRTPSLVAVDEAHCISHWGHDFRPDYRLLGGRLPLLRPAPVIALTATATPRVQDDIALQLGMTAAGRFIHGFRRTNIAVEVTEAPPSRRAEIVREVLADPARRPAIVYTPTRREAESLAEELGSRVKAVAYHAGMTPRERGDAQRRFLEGRAEVIVAVQRANQETGGAVMELGEAEYMVRASGYLASLDDFRKIPLTASDAGVSVRLGDVARIQVGPEMRRGIAELDGEGEVAGGVVIMRSGKNALATIAAVKAKLEKLKAGLPPGVDIVTVYDRSNLIKRAVDNLEHKLIEEFIVVAIVCALFLFHLRSALVAIVTLPVGILIAFIAMYYQGVNANILSLGGIAIAVGAMVDAAVVMIENAHKHIEAWHHAHPCKPLHGEAHWRVIGDAAAEVGPALFFSLLIIVLSFIPVFTLEAQEGRLFAPLAFTKTYAMAAAAGLAVTLIPVLMGYLIRGRIPDERKNPLNRGLIALYRPVLDGVLRYPKATLLGAAVVALLTIWPVSRLGGEFMPAIDEGDLLYMPSALPGLSAGKVSELLQQTDRLIKTVPEVQSVFGKAGRADSATDPAPLEMFETTIQFKPRAQWRAGMTTDKLVAELDRIVKVPGLSNIWVPPIRNRIDMLATGIKSPVGVKVAGASLREIDRITGQIERAVRPVAGVSSALAERLNGGRYVDIDINRDAAARYGLNIADVQGIVAAAIGGDNIGETVEGLQRFPISVRYPREVRDSVDKLRQLPVLTERGAQIRLGDVAAIRISDGATMLKSENARLSGWVYVDIRDRALSDVVRDMQRAVASDVRLPPGYSISWSGQFEYLERASARLKLVVPATLLIIFVLLCLTFQRFDEAALIMATLPFALAGGFWLLWLLGHKLSVAGGVGLIALAGVSAEFGVIMLLYLKNAWTARQAAGKDSEADLLDAIRDGAVLRVRPKAMTVAVIIAGLVPIMVGTGSGSEVMQRIAAPMVGGMITAPLLSMLVVPAVFLLLRRRQLRQAAARAPTLAQAVQTH